VLEIDAEALLDEAEPMLPFDEVSPDERSSS
jgi:hypothetical protein